MLNLAEKTQLLYSTGCSLPIGVSEEEILQCLISIEKLALRTERYVKKLKRTLYILDKTSFIKLVETIKEMLLGCYLPGLLMDCDYLIDHMEREKYVICETLLDRFCMNLTSLSVTFQTNKYKLELAHTYAKKLIPKGSITSFSSPSFSESSFDTKQFIRNIKKPMILAVDDSPEILRTLQSILNEDFSVVALSSADAAIKFLQSNKPDLFIFDIDMPKMNGFELAEKADIKSTNKPLIFLTSNANRENLITALQVGAVDFLVKPCDEKIILQKVTKILGATIN